VPDVDVLDMELRLGPVGRYGGKLVINGVDLSSHVRGVRLKSDINTATEITVCFTRVRINPVAEVGDSSLLAWGEAGAPDSSDG
jgi:hypothetical protein